MKSVKIKKYKRVECINKESIAEGIVAFQIVRFIISFYGSEIESLHDTKIMADGRQIVVSGCGFIPTGYELQNATD